MRRAAKLASLLHARSTHRLLSTIPPKAAFFVPGRLVLLPRRGRVRGIARAGPIPLPRSKRMGRLEYFFTPATGSKSPPAKCHPQARGARGCVCVGGHGRRLPCACCPASAPATCPTRAARMFAGPGTVCHHCVGVVWVWLAVPERAPFLPAFTMQRRSSFSGGGIGGTFLAWHCRRRAAR